MIRDKKSQFTFIILLFTFLFLSACGSVEERLGFGGATSTPAVTATPLPTPVRVFQSTISADGEIVLPLPPQRFSFQSAGANGTLAELYVIPGQQVQTGDLLGKADDTDLQTALRRSEANLALIEAQIASESAPALPGDIAEAKASVEAAQAELDALLEIPLPEKITQAEADLKLREIELQKAQEAYDRVAFAEGIGLSPQAADLQQATLNYERALAIYEEATKPATESQIAAARLKVVQAQNRLSQLQSGLRPEAKKVNEARLHEAQLQVEEALANLEKIKLYAPWSGIVTEVNAAPGISTGNASITIAQVEPLRFATTNFSERNLVDVNVGDEATIFLKTYPNIPFPAVVRRIELESKAKDGDTALFTVYFDLNSADFEIQPGMTGRVEIALELDR